MARHSCKGQVIVDLLAIIAFLVLVLFAGHKLIHTEMRERIQQSQFR